MQIIAKSDILMIHIILIAVLARVIHLVNALETPLLHNTGHLLHIQAHTHVAQEALVRWRLIELQEFLPLKIPIVSIFVAGHFGQERGQILWTGKVKRVYVGRARHPEVVLCPAYHHRHYIILEYVKKLLGDVVRAQGVLKGEKELVRARNVPAALCGLAYIKGIEFVTYP